MASVQSFLPVADQAARVLILGSMPGQASLAAGEYYAHPQNAFWPIMGALINADPVLPYRARTAALKAAGIALWDVLASCEREGSLDADIRHDSVVVNDFPRFLAAHPKITNVLFNGSMAESSFRRHVVPLINVAALNLARMPSTSPAHASLSRMKKLEVWRNAFQERGIITPIQKERP